MEQKNIFSYGGYIYWKDDTEYYKQYRKDYTVKEQITADEYHDAEADLRKAVWG